MRIGLVTGEYPPMQGGVGAYSSILARTWADQGHEVFILSSVIAQEDYPGIHMTNSIEKWRLPALGTIRRWAAMHQIEVINLQFETAAFAMSPWVHFLPNIMGRVPVVTTFHDLLVPYLFPKAGSLREWIVMHLARASAAAIATNQEDMNRIKHLPKSRLIAIGSNILTNPPPDYDRDAWRERIGARGGHVLAYFGFLNQSKGVEILLDALADLRNDSRDYKLVMIGGRTGTSDPTNTTYADHIDHYAHMLRLNPYIYWTGFVDDQEVSGYLDCSDIVVLPYRDGASYRRGSLMAAIQHGCAIITTYPQVDIPIFKDGENMLFVPINDSIALSDAIKQLMADDALRHKIMAGATELREQFRWDNIARDCIDLFQEVI